MDNKKIKQPIFMIGMPRSGTSILSEAISLHRDLGWISNYLNWFPKCIWFSYLNRITEIPKIGFHLRGKKKQGKGLGDHFRRFLPYSAEAFPVWEYCLGEKFVWDYLIDSEATQSDIELTKDYLVKALLYQGKQRIFAKITGPPRIYYLSSLFKDICFIHVIRDPRAVVASLINVPFWINGGGLKEPWWKNGIGKENLSEWHNYDYSIEALQALQWKRVITLALEEKKCCPQSTYIQVKYEDFASKPLEILNNIFKKLGLAACPAVDRYIHSMGKIKNMNYKYNDKLSQQALKTIEQITSNTAQKVGYRF